MDSDVFEETLITLLFRLRNVITRGFEVMIFGPSYKTNSLNGDSALPLSRLPGVSVRHSFFLFCLSLI